ncbi:alpha/beta hydrolase [Acidimangrovimonas sediminis]|uniref:alpha/beta hydrolase n=1 Tax=Acidimangrovimonas sediminis TaxID=2056283 RepID=UPI000C8060BF|nr:alpha/beta fold hydrolase [Acidimangrovimonas sediminis]
MAPRLIACRLVVVLLSLFAVGACAPRPVVRLDPAAAKVGTEQTMLYATTRNAGPGAGYGDKRNYDPSFGQVSVSVPPAHRPGYLEAGDGTPDPARYFTFTDARRYPSAARFRNRLAAAMKARGNRDVVLFVHGYNVNFAEGAMRLAQFMTDFDMNATPVYFSWSSAGKLLYYNHDRDAALFARDALQRTIEEIRRAGARSVTLVAHSMGAFLSMETLRQMAIQRPGWPARAIQMVVLISPDLNVSVFKAETRRIARLPQPFVIFTSDKDRALALSAFISGQKHQLGDIESIDDIAALPVTVINVTSFAEGRDFNHNIVGTSPALINLLKDSARLGAYVRSLQRQNVIEGTTAVVRRATEVLLNPAGKGMPAEMEE